MDWLTAVNEEKIIEWRHWLHRHPEVGFHEYETSAYVEAELKKMDGIEIVRPTETSVLAVIKGKGPGKTVGLRADIDALPIEEEADVAFKSEKPGVMHACGHDTHTAMLLGAADVLSRMRDHFSGTVKLIFQHAEEVTPGGAQAIIATGHLKDVDIFYGSHVMAPMAAGSIHIGAGPLMAAQNSFHLTIQGRGSHGSRPQSAIDPISIGAQIVNNLNLIVSRNINPLDNVVLSFGNFHSGSIFNVIPDTAMLDGTIRTTTPEARALMEKRVREVIDGICKAHGATYTLEYVHGYPALINDKDCAELVWQVAEGLFGKDCLVEAERTMGSEDFSYYGYQAPSVFVFIGGGDETEGCGYVNHHPKFAVQDDVLHKGTKLYVGFALAALK